MNRSFHKNLNRMALFTAFVIGAMVLAYSDFLRLAAHNIWLNGAIIGTALFGIGLCFSDIFKLIPEYNWMKNFFAGKQNEKLPPNLLRPSAMLIQSGRVKDTNAVGTALDMILGRFEEQRESVRYITNTLVFLGLLGTFWGLVNTVGGFADLVSGLNFEDDAIMLAVQSGLAKPLSGMGIAFACSLFGLGGSLVVGFLGLQVQMAQNSLFRELEENLVGASSAALAPIRMNKVLR